MNEAGLEAGLGWLVSEGAAAGSERRGGKGRCGSGAELVGAGQVGAEWGGAERGRVPWRFVCTPTLLCSPHDVFSLSAGFFLPSFFLAWESENSVNLPHLLRMESPFRS